MNVARGATLLTLLVLYCGNVSVLCLFTTHLIQGTNSNLSEALQFLRDYDRSASEMCFRVSSTQWNYSTNMTDFNKRRMIEEQVHKAKFDKLSWKRAVSFDWPNLPSLAAKRQFRMLITKGRASLPDDKQSEIYHLISEMKEIYSHTRICPYDDKESSYCDIELEPDIKRIMANSRNPDELLHVWKEWHDKVGSPMKNKFMRYVQIANQAARMIGFADAGEQLRSVYEDNDFESEIANAFQKLLPLYKHLFTYVRRKLHERYGREVIQSDGPIPAHLLGNLWAQDWVNIAELVLPYREHRSFDVSEEMLIQGYNPFKMFQMAEEFFTSLGLKPMPPEFWRYSLFERPNDRKVQCTASAWDFCNGIDYRIKQCTKVNMEHLLSTHHEITHIQYYLQYSDQPYLYRDGANPGFHEGVASAITLSIMNPTHLQRRELFTNSSHTYETNLNYLMQIALQKVAYAPYAYLVDQWRYVVFKEGVQNMNAAWWELRLHYQGVVPPVPRNEYHLDPVAKRHIAADTDYVKYFVALLLEFQIYEALCGAAGHVGQLHTCDLYRSREAGKLLEEILRIGKSHHWRDVIRVLTKGKTDRLSADSMLKYFHPLEVWLQNQNIEEKTIGWHIAPENTALFQPLEFNSSNVSYGGFLRIVLPFVIILHLIV